MLKILRSHQKFEEGNRKQDGKDNTSCDICYLALNLKKDVYLRCAHCFLYYHVICLKFNEIEYENAKQYSWYCHKCKICSICYKEKSSKAGALILCDKCDRAFHEKCYDPPIKWSKRYWTCMLCKNLKIQLSPVLLHNQNIKLNKLCVQAPMNREIIDEDGLVYHTPRTRSKSSSPPHKPAFSPDNLSLSPQTFNTLNGPNFLNSDQRVVKKIHKRQRIKYEARDTRASKKHTSNDDNINIEDEELLEGKIGDAHMDISNINESSPKAELKPKRKVETLSPLRDNSNIKKPTFDNDLNSSKIVNDCFRIDLIQIEGLTTPDNTLSCIYPKQLIENLLNKHCEYLLGLALKLNKGAFYLGEDDVAEKVINKLKSKRESIDSKSNDNSNKDDDPLTIGKKRGRKPIKNNLRLKNVAFSNENDMINPEKSVLTHETEQEIKLVSPVSIFGLSLSQKYTEKMKYCPYNGCDSSGHLSGIYEAHHTLAACPSFYETDKWACIRRWNTRIIPLLKKITESGSVDVNYFENVDKDANDIDNKDVTQFQNKKSPSQIYKGSPNKQSSKERSFSFASTYQSLNALNTNSPVIKKSDNGNDKNKKNIINTGVKPNDNLSKQNNLDGLCLDNPDTQIFYDVRAIVAAIQTKCKITYPPGDEIYREGPISVFEVDGRAQTSYCRNLCLLSKLFMESKTLCYEVQHFWFYVMTLADCTGCCHIVGYFSKEKQNFQKNTVSCVLILPHFMRKGFGWKLIDFSYLLARTEDKIGSPERPLSDHGLVTYRSYWNSIILNYLSGKCQDDKISIKDLSQDSGIHTDDIISTLQFYRLLKSWRGNHIILKNELEELKNLSKQIWRNLPGKVDSKFLHWIPK
ncbi:uncharacterized protein LOC135925882 isoform X2 [Gordionus sp. m RMFG-2023]|uniref:uncharacterized protein LOC135925882 isoform X2 n=1 Tax=Gordionus sp. m RMFG-2023 TaxID=3053472 RepID=UPI0031FC5790